MKLSVAMTVYNGQQYLVEQLDSIRMQTRTPDEVIICDDQSTDQSYEMVQTYIRDYQLENTWKLIANEKNLGYENNFYKAMELTTGDYVFFSDQDDIWLLDKLESMSQKLEENKDIMVLCSEYEPYYCTDDAPVISEQVLKQFRGDGSVEKITLNHNTVFIGSEGCTMAVRKSFLNDASGYWFDGWAQDEFVWKLSLVLEGCYLYHKPTLKRRLHSNNVSKRKMHALPKRIQFLKKLLQSHEAMLQYGKYKNLNSQKLKLIEKNIKSVKLRIEMLENKKLLHAIPLALLYFNNYHSRKSIPVEFLMALKG